MGSESVVVVIAPEGTVVGTKGGGSGRGEELEVVVGGVVVGGVVVGGVVVAVVVAVGGTVVGVGVVVEDWAAAVEAGSMTAPNRTKRKPAAALPHFTPSAYQPSKYTDYPGGAGSLAIGSSNRMRGGPGLAIKRQFVAAVVYGNTEMHADAGNSLQGS